MRLVFISTLFTVLTFFSQESFSQNTRSSYQLLWKISGKGLKKPSYLFGTMHVKDKRAFDFSDSVLVKLEECEGFAMEILPDSIYRALLQEKEEKQTKKNKGPRINLRKLLTEQELEDLDKRLRKEAGVSLKNMGTHNPALLNRLLTNAESKPDDRKVFLDAYLLKLAKQNRKALAGLEKLSEYDKLMKTMASYEVDELRSNIYPKLHEKYMEQMLQVYWAGDLAGIERMIGGTPDSVHQQMFTIRNITMARRIDSLIARKSYFIAVGSGHLPGQDGVIKLLQDKGYTVTPVPASFTGMAAQYKEKPLQTQWYEYTSKEYGYKVELPSEPFPYDHTVSEGVAVIQMYILPVIEEGANYIIMATPVGTPVAKGKENELLDRAIEGMKEKGHAKVLSLKPLNKDGYTGKEFELDNDEGFFRGRLYYRESVFYMLMTGGEKKEIMHSPEADRFLNSITFSEMTVEPPQKLVSDKGAFSIFCPVKLKEKVVSEGLKGDFTLYSGQDGKKQIHYIAYYVDPISGRSIADDSLYIASIVDDYQSRTSGTDRYDSVLTFHGYPARSFSMTVQGAIVNGQVTLRGSRIYVLAGIYTSGEQPAEVGKFLNSFELTDYKAPVTSNYSSDKDHFEVKAASEAGIDADTISGNTTYNFIDPNSGNIYYAFVENLSDYYERDNADSLYKGYKALYYEEGKDTLLSEKKGKKQKEYSYYDIEVKAKKDNLITKVRVIPYGKHIIQLMSFATPQQKRRNDYFFDSFRFTQAAEKFDPYSRKIDLLLKNITSGDSAVKAKAKDALYSYTFKTEDLPKIYKVLQRSYPEDTLQYGNIRSTLISELKKVRDQTTVPFLTKLYSTLDSLPKLQVDILVTLAGHKEKKSVDTLFSLLERKAPVSFELYRLSSSLSDSFALIKDRTKDMIALNKREKEYRVHTFELFQVFLDSNLISESDRQAILKHAIEETEKESAVHAEEDDYMHSTLLTEGINILAHFTENEKAVSIIKTLQNYSESSVSMEAVMTLISKGIPEDPKVLEKLAASPATRAILYRRLSNIDKAGKFPSRYKTQQLMAESDLYEWLASDEYTPEKIVFVEKKKITTYEDEEGMAYLFKFKLPEDKQWYIGVSGLQPLDKNSISASGNLTYSDFSSYSKAAVKEFWIRLVAPPVPGEEEADTNE